jgi:SnoaL-like domain
MRIERKSAVASSGNPWLPRPAPILCWSGKTSVTCDQLHYSKPHGAAMANPADSPAVQDDPISVAKKSYRAYADKDRSAIERLIADGFHFTSPLDNRIDRNTYLERCWPNSAQIADFKFDHLVQHGERVFVTYECTNTSGKSFRNTEILTVRQGKLVDVEVYFGWSLPHPAPAGSFTDASEQP